MEISLECVKVYQIAGSGESWIAVRVRAAAVNTGRSYTVVLDGQTDRPTPCSFYIIDYYILGHL